MRWGGWVVRGCAIKQGRVTEGAAAAGLCSARTPPHPSPFGGWWCGSGGLPPPPSLSCSSWLACLSGEYRDGCGAIESRRRTRCAPVSRRRPPNNLHPFSEPQDGPVRRAGRRQGLAEGLVLVHADAPRRGCTAAGEGGAAAFPPLLLPDHHTTTTTANVEGRRLVCRREDGHLGRHRSRSTTLVPTQQWSSGTPPGRGSTAGAARERGGSSR